MFHEYRKDDIVRINTPSLGVSTRYRVVNATPISTGPGAWSLELEPAPPESAAPDYEAYAERFWSTPPGGIEVREEPTFHPLGRDAVERHHAQEQDYSDVAAGPAPGQDGTC